MIEDECGCRFDIYLEPCEHHLKAREAGDGRYHITIDWRDKYDDWHQNRHKVNLERVQRIYLGLEDEQMPFDEASLADMLQGIADDNPTGEAAFVLAAFANALRGEDEYHRLSLRQVKKGNWQSPSKQHAKRRQQLAWIVRLERLQREGWQTDAAIHRIAETTGKSVSAIYAGIAELKG